MKKTFFAPMILAFFLFFILVIIPNKWIIRMIPANRVQQAATELNPFMFQGKYVQDQMLQSNKYLPIYGSSELARLDRFHPSNLFVEQGYGVTPFLIGRGGTESLIHFLNFSEHTHQLKGKKLVFILSPQWFQPLGADESHFEPNFSSLQGYDFVFNNNINPILKKMAIKRMLTYNAVKDDGMLSTLYEAEISNDKWTQKKAAMLRPFAQFYRGLLIKKDLYYTLAGGTKRSRDINKRVKNKSWADLQNQAAQLGRKESKSNRFLIINSQYHNVEKMLPELKNSRRGASYAHSLEYKDFQLVLDILKESGAKPLFVSVPVNGKWYDYVGFPKKGRTEYYAKIKKQIEHSGFPVADLSDHEYDPYFMKDTIHIGWKGWVYVDKAITDFYFGNTKEVARLN